MEYAEVLTSVVSDSGLTPESESELESKNDSGLESESGGVKLLARSAGGKREGLGGGRQRLNIDGVYQHLTTLSKYV
uniref:Uncharacterized protein n=1 Tax=Plectus sambesii TaxID=2011161 RepID=A0A914VED3_9BILA